MLTEKTLSRIRGLGLDANGYMTACEIVQQAIDEAVPRAKQTTSLALMLPADWPTDYQEKFWAAYPNKKAKKEAMKALDKVAFSGKISWIGLESALERYKLSREVQRGFCKHPATWLNKECWNDEEQTSPAPVERATSFFDVAQDLMRS